MIPNSWRNGREEWKLGYLAGIIDGEGTISIGRSQRGASHRYFYVPKVSFSNSYQELIITMQQEFGGTSSTTKPRFAKQAYQLQWGGNKGKELLRLILSKLIVKQKQAELFLTFPIGDGYKGPNFGDAEMALREIIYFKLKELNEKCHTIWTIGGQDVNNPD